METPLDQLKKIRLEKLQKLQSQGINPYSQEIPSGRQSILSAGEKELGKSVTVAGRLRSIRSHGGSTFADLEDATSKIQIFFGRDNLGGRDYQYLNLLDIGDFIGVTGTLFVTEAGQLTIGVSKYSFLTKSLRPLPPTFYGLKDVEERYRQRYVDLTINREVRDVFKIRARVISKLRELLDEEGFLEVETPVLQPLYGGATAKPFITRHQALGADLYLRISDELYLKRLIVGGFEKVYEIGKDFRNEGMDREHNPEFTMLEFYWAYATYQLLMEFSEKFLSRVVYETLGQFQIEFEGGVVDFKPPWERITFRDALIKHIGLDVDQLRSEEQIITFIGERGLKLDLEGVVGYAPLLDVLYKKEIRQKLTGPLFLIDHPYEMRPLAKRKEDDQSKAASFQLLVCGREIINAYNELNNPLDQRKRWEEEMSLASKGLEEYQVIDEDYLRALEYGMPPTAGWGMGIDRFISILTNNHTIKDVILFPILRPESVNSAEINDKGQEARRVPPPHQSERSEESKNKTDSSGRRPQNDNGGLPVEPTGDFPPRERVYKIISSRIRNQNLLRHCLAVEASMRALARKLGGNEEVWGSLGLIHDADWEETKTEPSKHTIHSLRWLADEGYLQGPIVQGLRSHNNRHTGLAEPQSIMEWALECCDELTGFIVSVALVRPEKKLYAVEVEHILKKWKEKSFAAAVDRSQIAQCEGKLGIKLPEFVEIVLNAMKEIASEIGL